VECSIKLQNLSEQVRECLQRAEECGQQAKLQCDPKLARDFLDLEQRWLRLARSLQLGQQLESFTSYNKKRRPSEILDRLARRTKKEE
jgi:hypothetical protein